MSDQSEIPGQPSVQDQVGYPPNYPANPYYQPGYGYPMQMPPQRATNGLAIAGIILSVFFWPLGLIFSIIGLVRSKALGGAGRTIAVIGLVLSVIFAAGSILAGVALVNAVKNSPVLDPGCRIVEPAIAELLPQISADHSDLDADSGDAANLQAGTTKLAGDLGALQQDYEKADNVTTHQSVKAVLDVDSGDLETEIVAVEQMELGTAGSGSSYEELGDYETFLSDVNATNNACDSL